MGKLAFHGVDPLRFNKEVRVRALQWIATEEEAFQEIVKAEYPRMVQKEVVALKQHLGNAMEGGSAKIKSSTGMSFDERVTKLARHRVGRKIALEVEKRKLNEWNLPDVIRSISSEYLLAVRKQAAKDGRGSADKTPVTGLDKIMPMDDAYRRSRRQKRKSVVQVFLENEERDKAKAKADGAEGGGGSPDDGAPQRAAPGRRRGKTGGAKEGQNPKPVTLSGKLLEMKRPDSHLRRAIRCGQWWELPINPREGEAGANLYARSCVAEEVRVLAVLQKQLASCRWDIHSLRLSIKDLSGVITALQTSQHLTHLNLGCTTIGDEVGGMLISQLDLQNILLVELTLTGAAVGNETCYALAAAFTRSQDFGVFKVVTGEGDAGETHIRKTLERLDLSANSLQEDGAAALFESLHLAEQLCHLNISRASLTNSVGMAVCEYLKRTPKLQELNVSWNNFTEDGAAAVAMGMSENSSMKKLDASYMAVGVDGISELCLGTLQISDICPGRFRCLDLSGCNPPGRSAHGPRPHGSRAGPVRGELHPGSSPGEAPGRRRPVPASHRQKGQKCDDGHGRLPLQQCDTGARSEAEKPHRPERGAPVSKEALPEGAREGAVGKYRHIYIGPGAVARPLGPGAPHPAPARCAAERRQELEGRAAERGPGRRGRGHRRISLPRRRRQRGGAARSPLRRG